MTQFLIGIALLASLSALLLIRLQARRKQAEAALDALPVAVIQLDADGTLGYVNPAGAGMLGLAGGAQADWRLVDHATRTPLLPDLLERAGKDGLTRLPAGARLINGHGLELEVEGTCQPLQNADGRTTHYLLQLRDVTEESEWLRQQPDLWDREPVSSLPGPSFMAHRLNLALINRRAGDMPMTYLEVRVRGIRAVYDAAGEAAGDSLVRHLTALLRSFVRETDLIARTDTESFAVLLTVCPAAVGGQIADKIQIGLDGFRFEWAGTSHHLASALGRVDVPPFSGGLDELLAAAQPGEQP